MLNSLKLSEINPSQINLTGVRLLVLFSLLVESPRTVEEINEYLQIKNKKGLNGKFYIMHILPYIYEFPLPTTVIEILKGSSLLSFWSKNSQLCASVLLKMCVSWSAIQRICKFW